MNAFLNPHNKTSLTGIIDVTANSISLYDETLAQEPTNLKDIFFFIGALFSQKNVKKRAKMFYINPAILALACVRIMSPAKYHSLRQRLLARKFSVPPSKLNELK